MADPFLGLHTIYGVDREHDTPYLTRIWIGRLRLHIFHRGDADPDYHDHPWDFWTFPLTSYVEDVVHPFATQWVADMGYIRGYHEFTDRHIVPAFRWSFRKAEHAHRVLGRFSGVWWWDRGAHNEPPGEPLYDTRRVITIVWRSGSRRKWGFLKNRDGKWCWISWRDYVFVGGKHAPCESAGKDADHG